LLWRREDLEVDPKTLNPKHIRHLTPLLTGYAVSPLVTLFLCYGYAVNHSEPSTLIPLMGYIFFHMFWLYIGYGYSH